MTGRLAKLALTLALLAAACGGGDEGATTTDAPSGNGTEPAQTTTTAAPTTTAADISANPGDDFCAFITAYAEEVEQEFDVIGMSPAELEAAFTANLDAMNQARDLAPNELRADVELFVDAYGGFIDFLAEYDFNFLALTEEALNDPRLQALEDPALEAAGKRIEEYCGIDNFITPNPAPGGGGSTGTPGADVPSDLPDELLPPGGVVVATVNVSGALSVTFDTEATTDEVIAYYTDVLGPPVQQLDDPAGALWTTTYEGAFLNLVVADIGGATQVNVSLGP